MIRKFNEFQNHDVYSKKIGMIDEAHDLDDLFGGEDCSIIVKVLPNEFNTHQVFNRLPGKSFIPNHVTGKFAGIKVAPPVSAVLPDSTVKTFSTSRKLGSTPLPKGTLYFKTPKINSQVQVAARSGKIFGARQFVDGKPVHLNLSRFPQLPEIQAIAEELSSSLGSEYLRFRTGLTESGPVLLAMENFKLKKPELIDLYFDVHESYLGKVPMWYRQHVITSQLIPYLNEYINREEVIEKCPYLL